MIGIHGFPDIWQALLFCMYPILLTRMYISVANVQEGDKVIVAFQLQATKYTFLVYYFLHFDTSTKRVLNSID